MTYRIKIVDHMDLFRAAHEAIPIPPAGVIKQRPVEWVKNAWQELYGVDVLYGGNGVARYLDFRDEKHYTVFLLSVDQNGR